MNPFSMLRKPKEVDELALAKVAERADRAASLLRDETLAEAFVSVESIYLQAWRGSDMLDVDLRERSHIAVLLLGDLKAQLISFVRDGEAARKQIEREMQRAVR